MSEHRVSMLGASWRRFEDPTRSRDPRVRELVSALAALPSPAPRAEFRAELRAQLVAIAPRIVAESAQSATPMIDIVPRPAPSPGAAAARPASAPPRHTDSWVGKLRRIPIGRPLAVAASVITAFAVLLGGAVWMSKKALPGDTLYGLKRASERVELATAGTDTEKARDYLDFAITRANEARDLLSRATASAAGAGPQASGLDAGTAKHITSTLASADSDVRSAAVLLGGQAVRTKSARPLDTMTTWAPAQLSRLNGIVAALPDGSLHGRAQSSADLVQAAVARAKALAPQVNCGCLASSGKDALGPIPCQSCTSPTSTPSTTPGDRTTAPRNHPAKGTKTRASRATTSALTPHATATTKAADPTATGSETPTPGLHLPSLPLHLPTSSLPISVKSCGLGVNLGLINIGIGVCPSS
jgi:hypothetical protein